MHKATPFKCNQNPQFEWAVSVKGSFFDEGFGIAVDKCGNSYVAGSFGGTATFGPFTLVSQGSDDVFVAKLDSQGEFVWAVSAGGTSFDRGFGIAVDKCGNSYVTGSFRETATFGPFTLISRQNSNDIFIAKLNPQGEFVWAVSAGGIFNDLGLGIAVDKCGNSYVTGLFQGTATFGAFTLMSQGLDDAFVAKLNPQGEFVWVVSAGGTFFDVGFSIAVDKCGNSYITGSFGETATFGAFTLMSRGSDDVFIAKLNPQGEFVWAVSAGGTSFDRGFGIAVDRCGNSYVTGFFLGAATFGPFTLMSQGSSIDVFVAKLDPQGEFVWAVSAGGTFFDEGFGIAVDKCGNSYVTGVFQGIATFGPFTLISRGSDDVFVAKLNPQGEFVWVVSAGGTSFDGAFSIAVDKCGNSYITGSFQETAIFGPFTLVSQGSNDIFVAKINQC